MTFPSEIIFNFAILPDLSDREREKEEEEIGEFFRDALPYLHTQINGLIFQHKFVLIVIILLEIIT